MVYAFISFLSNFDFIATLDFITCLQVSLKEALSSLWIQMPSFGLHGQQLWCLVSSSLFTQWSLWSWDAKILPQWFRSGLIPSLNWWRLCPVFSIQYRAKHFSWNGSREWKWPSCCKPPSKVELPSGPALRLSAVLTTFSCQVIS